MIPLAHFDFVTNVNEIIAIKHKFLITTNNEITVGEHITLTEALI